MASLFKRKRKDGSHVWYVTGYVNGRHFMNSTGTGDKKLAMEVLRRVEEDNVRIAQGMKPVEKLTPISLSEFSKIFLENRKRQNLSPKSLEAYDYSLNQLLQFGGDCLINSITEKQVQSFRYHLCQKMRQSSVNFVLRHLKAASAWAVNGNPVHYLQVNPFSQKNLLVKVDGENLPRSLSPEEKKRFFSVIERGDHKKFFQFLLLTGCRRNEALNLDWKDIEWDRRQVVFRKTKSQKDRIVPIGIELMQILLALDKGQIRPFAFQSDYVSHEFKKYVRKAGLDTSIHLHCLRHTAASDLVRQGAHPVKIQKLLGHSSLQVTERYMHTSLEDLREAAELLTCVA